MLSLLFASLVFAVTGEPTPEPQDRAPMQVAETSPSVESETPTEAPRACTRVRATGSRLGGYLVCGESRMREERRERDKDDIYETQAHCLAMGPTGCPR